MSHTVEVRLPKANMKRFQIARLLPRPRGDVYTHQFVDFLATQFKEDTTSPELFWLNVELAFLSLRSGKDDFTGEAIRHEAVDRVPTVEPLIRLDLPAIIDALFPKAEAAVIKKCRRETMAEANAQMRALKKTEKKAR